MWEEFPRARRRSIWLLLLISYLYFFQIYPGWISPNEVSRYYLISAIVDYGSLSIDQPIRQFFDIQDKAVYQGKAYSDKVIGTSLLGIVPYLIFKGVASLLSLHWTVKQPILWIRICCVIVPSILFLRVLGDFWKKISVAETGFRAGRSIAVFFYAFGTLAFPYSVQFISHYLLGICLFASFYFVFRIQKAETCPSREILISGVLAGLSLILEYPAVVPVAILGIYTLAVIPAKRKIVWWILGVLPFAILILTYHALIFGNPLDTPYSHKIDPMTAYHHAHGLTGITTPRADSISGMLFSRSRGLFFWSPVLLLSIPGFYFFIKKYRAEGICFLSLTVSVLLVYSGFYYWVGGWNLGSRYLSSVVPFVATPAYFLFSASRKRFLQMIGLGLGIWSVILMTVGTITFPYPPPDLSDPFYEMFVPLFLNGAFGFNIGDFLGIQFLTTAILFYVLLLICFLLMTLPSGEIRLPGFGAVVPYLGGCLMAILLLVGTYRTSTAPSATSLFVLGRSYYFLGYYQDSYRELTNALNAHPDPALEKEIVTYLSKLR